MEKTPAGRARIAREQKKYEIDLLQPGDPRFEKVYGARNRKLEEDKKKQKALSEEAHKDMAEKNQWANNKIQKKKIQIKV